MEKTIEIQLAEHGERIARVIEGWCLLLSHTDKDDFSVCSHCVSLVSIVRVTK